MKQNCFTVKLNYQFPDVLKQQLYFKVKMASQHVTPLI